MLRVPTFARVSARTRSPTVEFGNWTLASPTPSVTRSLLFDPLTDDDSDYIGECLEGFLTVKGLA